ncbi:MAG TPA: PorV/PorQ family protein [Gemmatimonadales bacterium]|nr:PorV/PorQ family protein [Gemmatimonadales bacterium]
MIRHSVARVAALALLAASPSILRAQATNEGSSDNTGYGTTSAEFLLIGANARGMALGGGYMALANDLGALYANPGALALLKRAGVQGSQLNYVADTKLNWGGVATPYGGGSGAVGFSIGTFGFSDQPVYTPQAPNGNGEFYSVSETYAAATIAKNFSDRFSVGVTAKGIFDRLGQVSGSAFAIDFGTHFHSQLAGKPIRFAFALTNLGTNLSYKGDPLKVTSVRDTLPGDGEVPSQPVPSIRQTTPYSLPTRFGVALAYDFISTTDARFTVVSEFNQMRSNKASFSAGGEFAADRIGGSIFGIALRGSFVSNPSLNYESAGVTFDRQADDKALGLAVGGGVNIASRGGFALGFDYAYRKLGALGDVNFFTVTVGW